MPYDPLSAAQQARFVQFVYSMYSYAPNSLTPPADPGLSEAGYNFLLYLNASDFRSAKFYGYMAVSSRAPGELILAIRGTEGLQEWLLDLGVLPLPYLGKGGVAAGFRSIADSFRFIDSAGRSFGDLLTVVATRHATTRVTRITIIGHSLGGALATLAAAQIAFSDLGRDIAIDLWTYGSPRVGLANFMAAFNEAVPNTYRIWNTLDFVAQVPTFPYTHVGQSEELKQTREQIELLNTTLPCEHHLTTYEWLLDCADNSPDSACQIVAIGASAGVMVVPADGAGLAAVNETAMGAAALAEALRQRP